MTTYQVTPEGFGASNAARNFERELDKFVEGGAKAFIREFNLFMNFKYNAGQFIDLILEKYGHKFDEAALLAETDNDSVDEGFTKRLFDAGYLQEVGTLGYRTVVEEE